MRGCISRVGVEEGPLRRQRAGLSLALRKGGWRSALGTSGDLKRDKQRAWYSHWSSFSFGGGCGRFSAKKAKPRSLSGRVGATPPRGVAQNLRQPTAYSPPYSLEKMTDLVAVWDVALSDGVHKIEFEHGTTSGKRVVYVDGKEEVRREWMFKLVGKETFCVGAAKTKATINIDAISGFAYEYTLEINGKSLKKYMENRSKTTNTWVLHLDGEDFRVVLEKDTMDVWCNGKKMETAGEFVDDGTETHFSIANHDCYIKAVSSGKRKEGIIHTLIVDNREIPEILE